MIQCQECEYCQIGPDGQARLLCDPFSTIKEPACLAKWQLQKLDTIARSHQATLDWYRRLAPLQEKMFRHMERELGEADEADQWKYNSDDQDDPDETTDL